MALNLDRCGAQVVRRAFGADFVVEVEPWPYVDGEVERWRAALGELGSVLPLEDGAAREALRREMYGIAPAHRTGRTGIGSRDAAIWLTIAADHARRGEEGHFITGDGDDFARDGRLRPELADELPEDGPPLRLHLGASAFLELLGTAQADAAMQPEELARWAEPALIAGLEDSEAILRAVLDRREPSLWYGAAVLSATPTEITRVQRYEREGDAVTIVNARWKITAELRYFPAAQKTNAHWRIDDIRLEGSAQVYLSEHDGKERDAAFISAQLNSNMAVDVHENGTAEVLTIG